MHHHLADPIPQVLGWIGQLARGQNQRRHAAQEHIAQHRKNRRRHRKRRRRRAGNPGINHQQQPHHQERPQKIAGESGHPDQQPRTVDRLKINLVLSRIEVDVTQPGGPVTVDDLARQHFFMKFAGIVLFRNIGQRNPAAGIFFLGGRNRLHIAGSAGGLFLFHKISDPPAGGIALGLGIDLADIKPVAQINR
ncbi:hypothetical protein SDC9_185272 [bioreactor metagenome]|uniref:Uncharacterized protein n=1 Tax=bioreactor metagenome TaxID=1076179 RepID=A0A645HFG7_9ZZZZ